MNETHKTYIEDKKMEKETYTLKELAERWSLNKMTLNRWAKAGKIKCFRVGNKFLVKKEEVERIEGGE